MSVVVFEWCYIEKPLGACYIGSSPDIIALIHSSCDKLSVDTRLQLLE